MPVMSADSRAVAACRIMLGTVVTMNAFEVAAILYRVEEGRLGVPGLLPIPITETTIGAWTMVSATAGLMIVLGVLTGLAASTSALLGAVALLWDQQNYSNHLWLTTLLVTYLAFARSDARWSFRALALGRREIASSPALLMVTQLSICYVFAGLSKLNPWWLAGDELRPSLRIALPEIAYPGLAVLVIATELFVGLGIWFRATRMLAIAIGVLLHVSIVALMQEPLTLVGFSLACLAVYPLVLMAPYAGDALRASLWSGPPSRATHV